MIDILAWAGALLSCLLSLPQAVQALRSGRLEGVSAATYWITLGNALVWAAWAVLAGEWAAGVPALVNAPAAVLILGRLRRLKTGCSQLLARRGTSREPGTLPRVHSGSTYRARGRREGAGWQPSPTSRRERCRTSWPYLALATGEPLVVLRSFTTWDACGRFEFTHQREPAPCNR